MDHQYRENGAGNICSDYNQMIAYVECSPNQLNDYRAIKETLQIPEKCWPFLYLKFTIVNFRYRDGQLFSKILTE